MRDECSRALSGQDSKLVGGYWHFNFPVVLRCLEIHGWR